MRFIILLVTLLLVGCDTKVPTIKPYRMDIQQGNVVTSKMLLQLRPGMTKSQVRYIMGTPLIQDSFHGNRWDYFYQMRQDGKVTEQRRVILDFENELLKTVRGDVVPSAAQEKSEADKVTNAGTRTVEPAGQAEEKSFFDKLKFWKSDDKETVKPVESATPAVSSPAETAKESEPIMKIDPTNVEPNNQAPVTVEPIKQAEPVRKEAPATEAVEQPKKKSLLDKLKFWKGDDTEAADTKVEDSKAPTEEVKSLSGVEIKEAPATK